eukprot:TRINITY_DN13778_c0_g1_i3.p1 TRINITY_DN13778_c0_g1~~TRINITY_DN13778_c0_g1_i3.p1  ORF type:complete len:424 (-),score=94.25 TRINITY_DN13778_c0_g1_i3:169-1440(-)
MCIRDRIGSGSFGEIFLARNVQTNQEVAVKMEEIKTKHPQLIYEAKVIQALQGGVGIPTLHSYGQEGDYNIMVMELLGYSLEDLFNLCNRKFSLKTVLMLADRMLSDLEYVHFKNYIHRDIKPDNFLIGMGKKSHMVYLIDFGLSKRYKDQRTNQHIPYRENKQLTGTARYASINTHKGIEQSRRDDLESLGYVLVYLLKGTLPWQGLKANSKQEKYNKILEKKANTPLEILCKGLPSELITYLNYCRNLRFDEKPDYVFLKKMFRELFVREAYECDYVYDWILIPLGGKNQYVQSKVPINLDVTLIDGGKMLEVLEDMEGGGGDVDTHAENILKKPNNTIMGNLHLGGQPPIKQDIKSTLKDLNEIYKKHEELEQNRRDVMKEPAPPAANPNVLSSATKKPTISPPGPKSPENKKGSDCAIF